MITTSILIIDDDPTLKKLIEFSFNLDHGYHVLLADNGEKGIELARENAPDIILLDWVMPKMDGLEVLKILKSSDLTKSIPTYMMTGKRSMEEVEQAAALGVDGYFTKPIQIAALKSRVRLVLTGIKSL